MPCQRCSGRTHWYDLPIPNSSDSRQISLPTDRLAWTVWRDLSDFTDWGNWSDWFAKIDFPLGRCDQIVREHNWTLVNVVEGVSRTEGGAWHAAGRWGSWQTHVPSWTLRSSRGFRWLERGQQFGCCLSFLWCARSLLIVHCEGGLDGDQSASVAASTGSKLAFKLRSVSSGS